MAEPSFKGNRVSWLETNDGKYPYRIYRDTAPFNELSLPETHLAEVPAGTNSYLDTDVTELTRYYYMVCSFVGEIEVFYPAYTSVVTGTNITEIGSFDQGGYYFGDITIGSDTYALIAAETDVVGTKKWKEASSDTPNASSANDGWANTRAMIIAGLEQHPAAQACVEFTGNGYHDWYLGSKDEMHVMGTNRLLLGALNLAPSFYWSSTQSNANYAWSENMGTSSQTGNIKASAYLVRPIRRVKIY